MEGSAGKGWCSHTQFADCLSPSSCSGGGGVRVQPPHCGSAEGKRG